MSGFIGFSAHSQMLYLQFLFHHFKEKLHFAFLATALFLPTVQALQAQDFKIGSIQIEQPWARATPSGAQVGGGYMLIKNEGSSPDRLVSATAEIAGRVEIHQMSMNNGIMTMRPLENGVEIPAKATVALTPNSYHFMFLDLKQPLAEGKSFSGTMTFEKAGTINVTFSVEPIGAKGPEHEGQHQSMAH